PRQLRGRASERHALSLSRHAKPDYSVVCTGRPGNTVRDPHLLQLFGKGFRSRRLEEPLNTPCGNRRVNDHNSAPVMAVEFRDSLGECALTLNHTGGPCEPSTDTQQADRRDLDTTRHDVNSLSSSNHVVARAIRM